MDLAQEYLARLQSSGVHMTAYIANLLIKGYAADGAIEEARAIFERLADPPSGMAAPGNHVPHESAGATPAVSSDSVSYREVRTDVCWCCILLIACVAIDVGSHVPRGTGQWGP